VEFACLTNNQFTNDYLSFYPKCSTQDFDAVQFTRLVELPYEGVRVLHGRKVAFQFLNNLTVSIVQSSCRVFAKPLVMPLVSPADMSIFNAGPCFPGFSLSILFPLAVAVLYWKQARRDTMLQLAWLRFSPQPS